MSVYTMSQPIGSTIGHTAQTPYEQSLGGFGSLPQQGWQSPFGGVGSSLQQPWQAQFGAPTPSPLITDLAYRIASATVSCLAETLRFDQHTLQAICSQGQLPQQAFTHLVAESTRRIAPIVASTVAATTQTPMGVAGLGVTPSLSMTNGFGGQGGYGAVHQYAQSPYSQGLYGQSPYGQSLFGQYNGAMQHGSPQFGAPQWGSPQFGAAQWGSPQFGAAQWGSPQFGAQQWGSPQMSMHGSLPGYAVPFSGTPSWR